MNEAFQDTRQALHVAYLVLSLPPRQKAPFRNMLIRIIESIDKPTKAQEAWLNELRGPQGEFDSERLTLEEFRAQCAMITDAARTRLPSPEYAAVLARFAHGDEKVAGINTLAVWSRKSSGITAVALLRDLTAWNYLPRTKREGVSIRDLAERHKIAKSTAFRAAKWMAARFTELENLAVARLEAGFVSHGVVPSSTHPACDYAQPVAA
ncbi:GP66 protein [Pandoraea sp. SD6-2]|uniref:GP66 protein n=1 Tax=Pandoraea sp. SD6-2 TaxID=1286093 RepID=UPI0003306D21|nr:GP66 protein [Pandoraea sp. SD6-2]EON13137.1 GP66 protein [Pandoraea sp. SD6-2]